MSNGTAEYPEEDRVAVVVNYSPPVGGTGSWITSQMQRAILDCIAAGVGGVSLSPTPRGVRSFVAPCAKALTPHLPGRDASAVEGVAKHVVGDLIARDWVQVVDTIIPKASRGSNKGKGLTVHWSRTPWAADPAPGAFVS
jgi:hypothetical protein